MDDSFNLARHVARFMSLLRKQPDAVDQQKLELRALVLMTKEATLRLSTREGQLVANGLAVPSVLAGVRDLADLMIGHRVESIEIAQGMAPGELLAVGRLLAEPFDAEGIERRFRAFKGETVTVELGEITAPVLESTAAAEQEPAAGTPERVPFLLDRVNAQGESPGIAGVFEEVAFAVEQATREGRTDVAIDAFSALIGHESGAQDAEVRRYYVLAVRRLTKPVMLTPIARAVVDTPVKAAEAEAILTRCGTDGVDAVADQYTRARTAAERATFRSLLDRLPAADAGLTAMLGDTRPSMARIAAELLGERRPLDGDRALADQLTAGDARVRRAVVRALGHYDTPFSIDAIGRVIDDLVVEVRLEAVAALARKKGAKVGDIIGRAIDREEDAEVQAGMLGVLGRVATADAVAKLAKAAEAGSGLFASRKGAALRVAAVRALAEARTAAARTALMSLANDKEREVRDAVAKAIGR